MKKRILSILLSVALLLGMLPAAFPAAAETDDVFTYMVEDEKAIILDCDETVSGDLEIPAKLGGYPVNELRVCAFQNCTELTGVTVPDSVVYIGDWVFRGCTALEEIKLPAELLVLGTGVFENTAFYNNEENWIDGILYLDQYMIRVDLLHVGALNVREGTTQIADFACDFSEAWDCCITTVTLPSTLKTIGNYAFWFCNMSSINLPEGLEKIGDGALMNCFSLSEIAIPASVRSIGAMNFQWCAELAFIDVAKENAFFSSVDGVLYDKNKTKLIKCPEAKERIEIASGVTALDGSAFRGCRRLGEVVIPKSVKTISDNLFPQSEELKTIFYLGTKSDRQKMEIHEENEWLFAADWFDRPDDVSEKHWALPSIFYCRAADVMRGTSESTFSPAGFMTRSQVVTILYRLEDSPAEIEDFGFSDVAADTWYTDAVNWAASEGIIEGVGENRFAPDRMITRAEIATMLYNYAAYCGEEMESEGSLDSFADAESVAEWAQSGMKWAVGQGLIGGISEEGETYLRPDQTATRAEGATLMMRFMER